MSLGYGGSCKKELEDEYTVIYAYLSYNYNDKEYLNENRIFDGTIMIKKSGFIEPEIHEKNKKMPNGKKKLVVKRIPQDVDIDELIQKGDVTIDNSPNTWSTYNDVDIIARTLCFIIFRKYQEEGIIPDALSFYK